MPSASNQIVTFPPGIYPDRKSDTEIGLVTVMTLVSKHATLIVKFANDLRRTGKAKRETIQGAAALRLRPILMTTAAMVLGVVPLIIATGAGAVSRFNIGLVIGSGLLIGTAFTIFVVPAAYMLLAARHVEVPGHPRAESPGRA